MMYRKDYNYVQDLGIEAMKYKARMKRTDALTDDNWISQGKGSGVAVSGYCSMQDVYDTIKYTIGQNEAENFLNNF